MFSSIRKAIERVRLGVPREDEEAARRYLDRTHPTLIKRGSPVLCAHEEFKFQGTSQNGEYIRYHFSEGTDKRIIYVVLCDEEREKIIQLFDEKMRNGKECDVDFRYKDSMRGMFIGEEVRHRFFSKMGRRVAFMSDDGRIEIWHVLQDEDMD